MDFEPKEEELVDNFNQWSIRHGGVIPNIAYTTGAKHAWEYQQKKIDLMRTEWAETVCHGKDGLRNKIEDLNNTIEELKKFNEESLLAMNKMEVELKMAKGTPDKVIDYTKDGFKL